MENDNRNRELDEVKKIIEGLASDDNQHFSLDEIMSEYRYESTLFNRPHQTTVKQPVNQKTRVAQKPSEERKEVFQKREKETFDQAFKPSEDFVSKKNFVSEEDFVRGLKETMEEEQPTEQPQKPLLARLRSRRRATEAAVTSIPVDKAAVKLIPYIRFLTIRLGLACFFCVFMVFLTFSHRLELSLPTILVFVEKRMVFMSILTAMQILVMICGVDVMARGLFDLVRLRPAFESIALLSCLASILYVATSFFNPNTPVYLPYSAVSALSVFCAMWSHRLSLKACQLSYQTVAATECPFVIHKEETLWPGGALMKTKGDPSNFVSLTEQPDGALRFTRFFVPLEIIAAFVAALVVSDGFLELPRFFWTLSAILSVSAPFCGPLSFTLPFLKISKRLSRNGTALAGWHGACAFFEPSTLILTDRDLFPTGTVTLNGLKVFDGYSFNRMITYAASLTAASESCLSHAFAELLHNQNDAIRSVNAFRYYEAGGLGGEIGKDSVLIGNSSFMLSTGIRLPQGIKLANVLFVAVNMELVGVFAIHYNAASAVSNGLSMLLRNGITPLFCTRDVNLTPPFVGKTFGLKLGHAEYPEIEQRLELSQPERKTTSGAKAVMNRDALNPTAEAIVAGRRLGRVTRLNLVIYLLCSLAGFLIMTFLSFRGEMAVAAPRIVIAYLALWTLPTMLISSWVHRY